MTSKIDRYEIIDEIGSGGFATVFRALDTVLEREVALKVMRPLLTSDFECVTCFQYETKTASSLEDSISAPSTMASHLRGQ
jgi:serine/threonine-protein kinase